MAVAPRNFHVKFCMNGIMVKIGCQEVVFINKDTFIEELRQYLNDPISVEKAWLDDAMFEGRPTLGAPQRININRPIDMGDRTEVEGAGYE